MQGRTTYPELETSHLTLLRRMDDFTVAEGDSDVRGWEVVAKDGRRIGTVDHLLVDPEAMRVAYLGVGLDRDLRRPGNRRDHVLVAVETARISEERNRVFIPQVSAEVANLPDYEGDRIEEITGGTASRRPATT